MTLSAGSRLGPYEILAPIGAGGMGEVYRARDPLLGREVAVRRSLNLRHLLRPAGRGQPPGVREFCRVG